MDLLEQIKRDEGLRLKPYFDSVGKTTIGYGRNLADVGISKEEAEYLLANDLAKVKYEIGRVLPWTSTLDPVRLAVLHNMAFNMGVPGLLDFRDTLKLIEGGYYSQAADEMLNSRWARQTGARAQRLSLQMKTGNFQ